MHFPYGCPLIDGECSCPELPEFGNGLFAEIQRRHELQDASFKKSLRSHREAIRELLLDAIKKDPSLLDIIKSEPTR